MKKNISVLKKLIAFALSFSFLACHNTTDLGFDLGGDGLFTAVYTDTVSLGLSTVLSDSAINGNASFILAGKANDPELGSTQATAYFQASLLPQYNYNTGEYITNSAGVQLYDTLTLKPNPILDSLKLQLYCEPGRIYGDSMAISKFSLHRLSDFMKTSGSYNSSDQLPYESQPLALIEFNIKTLRKTAAGTLVHTVSLPKSLNKELVDAASNAKGDNAAFSKTFKGFAIVPDKSNEAVYGFTASNTISNLNTYFVAYYHFEGDTAATVHRVNAAGTRFTGFDFDRSKTNLSQLNETQNELPFAATKNRLYVQGGSGINTKIDLKAIEQLKNIKIAKAVIELEIDKSTLSKNFPKNYFLAIAEADSKNQQKRTKDNALAYIYDGYNDSKVATYYTLADTSNFVSLDITKYLQRQQLAGSLNKQLLVLPATPSTTAGMGFISNDQLSRLVFLRPRLLLYYNRY